jgi:hypothetical protein
VVSASAISKTIERVKKTIETPVPEMQKGPLRPFFVLLTTLPSHRPPGNVRLQ